MFIKTQRIGNYTVGQSHIHKHTRLWKARYPFDAPRVIAGMHGVSDCFTISGASAAYSDALRKCPSISVSPNVQGGRPCIDGTRIPVHLVLWAVEHTGSIKGAIKSYPDLTIQQVKDALYFAELILGSLIDVNAEAEIVAG